MSAFGAHTDDNQQFSIGGVVGTMGTADTQGTAKVLPFGVNPDTGAMYVQDLSSPSGFEGGTVSVGTSPVELTFTGVTQSIMITADHANGTMIYLGGSAVAQSGSAAITSLYPGESCSMDLNDATAPLYAVGGTTSQKVYKVGLT